MKLSLSARRHCELTPGQVRRVPQRLSASLVGYHVCCSRCGFVTIALDRVDGLVITEQALGDELALTFSRPVRCSYCAVLIGVAANTVMLQEDDCVRQIPYAGDR
jgi:hypothetical protein